MTTEQLIDELIEMAIETAHWTAGDKERDALAHARQAVIDALKQANEATNHQRSITDAQETPQMADVTYGCGKHYYGVCHNC